MYLLKKGVCSQTGVKGTNILLYKNICIMTKLILTAKEAIHVLCDGHVSGIIGDIAFIILWGLFIFH